MDARRREWAASVTARDDGDAFDLHFKNETAFWVLTRHMRVICCEVRCYTSPHGQMRILIEDVYTVIITLSSEVPVFQSL